MKTGDLYVPKGIARHAKLILFSAVLTVFLSCSKERYKTISNASIKIFDTEVTIISDDFEISTGEYNDIEYKNNELVYLWLFNSINFNIDSNKYILKTDFVILEDSSRVFYNYHNYTYKNPNDYFMKMKSLSNTFINIPDSSSIFTDESTFIDVDFLTSEIEKYNSEGIIIQLFDKSNDKVYISNLKADDNSKNNYEIIDYWIEEGVNGNSDRLYIKSKFNFELYNIENYLDKVVLESGECTFWTLDQ